MGKNWHNGIRYDVSVSNDLRYTNSGWTRGKITVHIRDKFNGNKISKRIGDWMMIGNFAPIWINWKGERIIIEDLLKVKW